MTDWLQREYQSEVLHLSRTFDFKSKFHSVVLKMFTLGSKDINSFYIKLNSHTMKKCLELLAREKWKRRLFALNLLQVL